MRNKVNILGSCVSRVCMLDGNRNGHGIADDDMDLGYYFHNQNIVCLMTPPSFSHEEIDMIKGEELYDANNLRGLRQCLYKDTINMLLESDAQWLVMDLYDMQIDFCMLGKGMFSPYNYEFFNTSLYERYKELLDKIPNVYVLGRLAEYKYYNIDAMVLRALMLTDRLKKS